MVGMCITGAYFAQGSTHDICQDYAEATDTLAVLSDGCSGSPQTDIGARLVVRSLMQGYPAELGGLDCLHTAEKWRKDMGLNPQALDATRIFVCPILGGYWAVLQGDGHILARGRETGLWRRWDVLHPHGAPYYDSYRLSPERDKRYREVYGTDTHVHQPVIHEGEPATIITLGSLSLELSSDSYDMVVGASDGLSSFVDTDREPVPVGDVVEKLLKFPQVGPGALERRVRRFTRKTCPKLGWVHTDDLSVIMVARP